MTDMTTAQKMDHFEVEQLKDDAYPQHGMIGFDTTEDQLPPGYFRSSFFIGTMLVVMSVSFPRWFLTFQQARRISGSLSWCCRIWFVISAYSIDIVIVFTDESLI